MPPFHSKLPVTWQITYLYYVLATIACTPVQPGRRITVLFAHTIFRTCTCMQPLMEHTQFVDAHIAVSCVRARIVGLPPSFGVELGPSTFTSFRSAQSHLVYIYVYTSCSRLSSGVLLTLNEGHPKGIVRGDSQLTEVILASTCNTS